MARIRNDFEAGYYAGFNNMENGGFSNRYRAGYQTGKFDREQWFAGYNDLAEGKPLPSLYSDFYHQGYLQAQTEYNNGLFHANHHPDPPVQPTKAFEAGYKAGCVLNYKAGYKDAFDGLERQRSWKQPRYHEGYDQGWNDTYVRGYHDAYTRNLAPQMTGSKAYTNGYNLGWRDAYNRGYNDSLDNFVARSNHPNYLRGFDDACRHDFIDGYNDAYYRRSGPRRRTPDYCNGYNQGVADSAPRTYGMITVYRA